MHATILDIRWKFSSITFLSIEQRYHTFDQIITISDQYQIMTLSCGINWNLLRGSTCFSSSKTRSLSM
jgi:hypothetical protein